MATPSANLPGTPKGVYSLPRELLDVILDLLDVPSLLAWRGACKRNEADVNALLIEGRDRILRHFVVDDVEAFLGMLTWYGAVVTGEAALAFFLRDHSALGNELEVAVGRDECGTIQRELEEQFHCTPLRKADGRDDERVNEHHPVTRRFRLPSGTTLLLSISHTSSPLAPVAQHMLTAHINYFSAESFGSGYAALTLRRVTFKPDVELLRVHEEMDMQADLDVLESRYGFVAATDVSSLVPPGTATNAPQGTPHPDILPGYTMCLRAHYLCPGQERFFGDRGSLVDFFDLSTIDEVQRDHLAPFGAATVWRMTAYEACVSACDGQNTHLRMRDWMGYLSAVHEPFRFGPKFMGWEWL
ncbi:hypothetical protein C8T65DRAFT_691373 [Cerioporus squamosus]|nr:hypothetical protein C8T65DRAFT_691373 [Cerioporus squamosus]